MNVCVFQIGARRHYAVSRGIDSQGCLKRIVTNANSHCFPWRSLPRSIAGAVANRRIEGVSRSRISDLIEFDILSAALRLMRKSTRSPADWWVRQNRIFGKLAARRKWVGIDTVYGYNGAALEVFEKAKRVGLKCVLDQTAAAWRFNTTLLRNEVEQFPDWEPKPGDLDQSGLMTEREESEWELADVIICGSQFVVNSIRQVGGPFEKCRVVPYPVPDFGPQENSRSATGDKINAVFLGTMQLRKGIQYLWEASQLGDADVNFRAFGPSTLSAQGNGLIASDLGWQGPVPRSDVKRTLESADVFVFPTLSEGSANVCLEAIAAGVPVVTTENSGIPLRPGVIHVPLRDPPAINRALYAAATMPFENTIQRRSIDDYGRDLIAAINGIG